MLLDRHIGICPIVSSMFHFVGPLQLHCLVVWDMFRPLGHCSGTVLILWAMFIVVYFSITDRTIFSSGQSPTAVADALVEVMNPQTCNLRLPFVFWSRVRTVANVFQIRRCSDTSHASYLVEPVCGRCDWKMTWRVHARGPNYDFKSSPHLIAVQKKYWPAKIWNAISNLSMHGLRSLLRPCKISGKHKQT